MPLIEGEKYACQSCIKGHRVSGCNHSDRELFHINPKGRPVKQCEHCRSSRKSKSHHVKCDCGDKKDKHSKDKADAKGEQLASASHEFSNHPAVNATRCCCHSGDKCICGVKKESLDLTLDIGKQSLHAARARPKVAAAHSESTLTVFANGHHQPCHRKNNTAHVFGAPYKLSRPHTLHGSAAFVNLSQGNAYTSSETSPQRAVDTHSLSNLDFYAMLGSSQSQRPAGGVSMMPMAGGLDTNVMQDAIFAQQSSMFSPDGNSPSESQLSDGMPTQQWSWTGTMDSINRSFGYGSLSTSPSQDCLPNFDNDWAIPSAGLNPVWSAGDLPLDPSKLSDTLTQPISHSGESNKLSNPGLTTASSSHSDMGEPVFFGDFNLEKPQSAASETIFWEDTPTFRFATSTPNEPRSVPASIPASMPAFVDETKSSTTSVTTMASASPVGASSSFSSADYGEMTAFAMPNNVDDIPNDPWILEQTNNINYSTWI